MNLKKLLAQPTFAYLEPINEKADLEREIITVESTETPDVHRYMAENALIITTAMYYANQQHELLSLMENLLEKKACGLAIKVDRFLGKLDPEVIKRADELRFPLLLIPSHKTLGEVYQELLMYIWQDANEDLVFALNTQKVFSNLLVHNSGMKSILSTLRDLLKVDVALIDPFGNIEYSTQAFARKFDKRRIRELVGDLNADVLFHSAKLTDRDEKEHVVGIHLMKLTVNYPHFLLLLDSDKLRYPVSNFIIDQALLSLVINMNRDLNTDYEKLERNESAFKYMLRLCRRGDEQAVMDYIRAEKMTYFESGRTIVLYFTEMEKFFPAHMHHITYTLVYHWLDKKLDKLRDYELYPLREEKMYLIQTSEIKVANIIDSLLKHLDTLQEILGIELSAAIGSTFYSIDFQTRSYQEALNAIEHGTTQPEYPHVKIAKPQDFRSLFAHINDRESRSFCLSVLGDLYDDDSKTSEDYRETLRVWLMHKSDVSRTAKALFIHRNTVRYRLERCREILHSDLTDPVELFNLSIALNLMHKDHTLPEEQA